jgi:hypothetical protein
MSVCAICGGKSVIAINCLLSTRRVRPRAQKCSRSLPLCKSCLRASRGDSEAELALSLLELLHEAYAAIAEHPREQVGGAE